MKLILKEGKHQAELLEKYFDATTMLCQSRTADRRGKITFQLSICVRKNGMRRNSNSTQQQNPVLTVRKQFVGRTHLMLVQLFMEAHHLGLTHLLKGWQTQTKKVSNVILNSKSKLLSSLKSENKMNWLKSFNKSEENKLRSLNTYYFHDVLGKRNNLTLRKQINKQSFRDIQFPILFHTRNQLK